MEISTQRVEDNIGHQKEKTIVFNLNTLLLLSYTSIHVLIGQDGSIFHRIQSDQKSCNGCLQHCHTQNL